jgi:hypothetical protein
MFSWPGTQATRLYRLRWSKSIKKLLTYGMNFMDHYYAFTYNSYWQVVTKVSEDNTATICRVEISQAGKIIRLGFCNTLPITV